MKTRSPKSVGLVSLVLLTFWSTLATAQPLPPPAPKILSVTTLADSGTGSFRAVLAGASSGDTIVFSVQGTIFLTSGKLTIDKDVQIMGSGVNQLFIDAQNNSAIFLVTSNATASISDLTLRSGFSKDILPDRPPVGGAIENNGNLTLARCVIRNCGAVLGGAIFNANALTMRQCSILSNKAGLRGGGIYEDSINTTIIDSCTFFDNAGGLGFVTGEGGGIFKPGGGTLFIVNSTFSQNRAPTSGALAAIGGTTRLDSCTVVSNLVNGPPGATAGGIRAVANLQSRNSIIAGNISRETNGPPAATDVVGPLASLGYNLIQGTNFTVISGDTTGNIYNKDPLVGPLQNNGGPTLTHALLAGSSAIDQGSAGTLANDQRGFLRIYDVPDIPNASDGCDIGAYEFGAPALPPGWLTQDIGSVSITGNAIYSNGTFQVYGAGSDIWSSSDHFRFVYLPLLGDGTIIARVASISNTDPIAKAGVMFRQSLAPNSINAAVIITRANGNGITYRNVVDGTTFIAGDSNGAPYWVKMNRTGRKFTGFISADGVTWKQVAQPDIAMGQPVLAGFCVSAHNETALNVSTFDNITVIGVTNVPVSNLPPPWTNNDVGLTDLAGSSVFSNGVFTVAGDGTGVWGNADGFQFTWQPWTGDGTIIARVISEDNTDPSAEAGVMFRQSLDPNALNATVVVTPSNGTGMTYRNIVNGTTFIAGSASGAPRWIKLNRTGTKFTGFSSPDGVNWQQIAQPDIKMTDPIMVGLCVSSRRLDTLNISKFDNVSVTGVTNPPTPLPPPWTNNDVGPVGLSGSASFSNGVFTVIGDGTGIWDSADAFQFVWQPWSGDGAIIARVLSVANTDPSAEAGVMFRQSLAAGSVNTTVIVTPSHGTGLTYRNIANGTTFIASDFASAPYWVKIIRTGRKFTGFTSADGITWKQIAQPDILMTDPIFVGLCVSSRKSNLLNTSTFDNVTVSPSMSITLPGITSASGMVITWPASGILQTSTNVVGPYYDVIGASSPFTNLLHGNQQFFRIKINPTK